MVNRGKPGSYLLCVVGAVIAGFSLVVGLLILFVIPRACTFLSGLQLLILGSVLPLFILGIVAIANLREQVKTSLGFLSAGLVLIGVFAMRWNVVIGGQLMSKSLRGFTSYSPPLLGVDGIIVAAVLMILPFIILAVITYLIPPWQEEVKLPERKRLGF